MEPFIQIIYNGITYRTNTSEEVDKNPVWDQIFEIPIYLEPTEATITCFDEDLLSNDNVGEAKVDIQDIGYFLTSNVGVREWVKLYHRGKVAAQVLILSKYTSIESEQRKSAMYIQENPSYNNTANKIGEL